MKKTSTDQYEFAARLFSNETLITYKRFNKVYIVTDNYIDTYYYLCNTSMKTFENYNKLCIICSAHTVRGAWKKAVKILNQLPKTETS
jgi:hypothetical protein